MVSILVSLFVDFLIAELRPHLLMLMIVEVLFDMGIGCAT